MESLFSRYVRKTKMIKKALVVATAAVVFSTAIVTTANAQEAPTPEQVAAGAADTRQSVFKLLRFYLVPLVGMARGAPFDAELAEKNGRRIAALAPSIPDVFMHDTRDFDVETEALDVIWEDIAEFENKAMALMNNANAFADLAATGDRGQTLGAFRALGGSCGDCHDTFRVDND
jgi:cytochrome c556